MSFWLKLYPIQHSTHKVKNSILGHLVFANSIFQVFKYLNQYFERYFYFKLNLVLYYINI